MTGPLVLKLWRVLCLTSLIVGPHLVAVFRTPFCNQYPDRSSDIRAFGIRSEQVRAVLQRMERAVHLDATIATGTFPDLCNDRYRRPDPARGTGAAPCTHVRRTRTHMHGPSRSGLVLSWEQGIRYDQGLDDLPGPC